MDVTFKRAIGMVAVWETEQEGWYMLIVVFFGVLDVVAKEVLKGIK
jgi:hypothetical protein